MEKRKSNAKTDPRNVKWSTIRIEDYAAQGSVQGMWAPYHGKQQGDPAKLGEALVKVVRMANPPGVFIAGSDALAMIPPAIEARLREARAHEALSRSTDGAFNTTPDLSIANF